MIMKIGMFNMLRLICLFLLTFIWQQPLYPNSFGSVALNQVFSIYAVQLDVREGNSTSKEKMGNISSNNKKKNTKKGNSLKSSSLNKHKQIHQKMHDSQSGYRCGDLSSSALNMVFIDLDDDLQFISLNDFLEFEPSTNSKNNILWFKSFNTLKQQLQQDFFYRKVSQEQIKKIPDLGTCKVITLSNYYSKLVLYNSDNKVLRVEITFNNKNGVDYFRSNSINDQTIKVSNNHFRNLGADNSDLEWRVVDNTVIIYPWLSMPEDNIVRLEDLFIMKPGVYFMSLKKTSEKLKKMGFLRFHVEKIHRSDMQFFYDDIFDIKAIGFKNNICAIKIYYTGDGEPGPLDPGWEWYPEFKNRGYNTSIQQIEIIFNNVKNRNNFLKSNHFDKNGYYKGMEFPDIPMGYNIPGWEYTYYLSIETFINGNVIYFYPGGTV